MKSGVHVLTDNTKKVFEAIKALSLNEVLVGIPESTDKKRKDGGTIGNAAIGYQNEYGSAANNIPARPFLVPGVRAVQDQAAERLRAAAVAGFNDANAGKKGLNEAGILAVSSVKRRIVQQSGINPLADSTLKARQRKGRGTKALIDTGSLLNSITYVVRKRK